KQSCSQTKHLDTQCATYCYGVVRPMLEFFRQCRQKDEALAELKEQVANLKQQLAVYKERESQNQALGAMSASIDALSKQLVQLSDNTNEKQRVGNEVGLKPVDCSSWKVVQRRSGKDDIDFYRNWAAYREGFGDPEGSF
ncbi:hypothetical protein KR222_010004, partial [Zaprionus bogoriensis]